MKWRRKGLYLTIIVFHVRLVKVEHVLFVAVWMLIRNVKPFPVQPAMAKDI